VVALEVSVGELAEAGASAVSTLRFVGGHAVVPGGDGGVDSRVRPLRALREGDEELHAALGGVSQAVVAAARLARGTPTIQRKASSEPTLRAIARALPMPSEMA
jgi:hypothetical protein